MTAVPAENQSFEPERKQFEIAFANHGAAEFVRLPVEGEPYKSPLTNALLLGWLKRAALAGTRPASEHVPNDELSSCLASVLSLAVIKWGNRDSDANLVFEQARGILDRLNTPPSVEGTLDRALKGWSLAYCPDNSHMSDDFNARHRWEVRRTEAPYEFEDGCRSWFGRTAAEAMQAANISAQASIPDGQYLVDLIQESADVVGLKPNEASAEEVMHLLKQAARSKETPGAAAAQPERCKTCGGAKVNPSPTMTGACECATSQSAEPVKHLVDAARNLEQIAEAGSGMLSDHVRGHLMDIAITIRSFVKAPHPLNQPARRVEASAAAGMREKSEAKEDVRK